MFKQCCKTLALAVTKMLMWHKIRGACTTPPAPGPSAVKKINARASIREYIRYVGDYGGHCVSVFTTKGEYVTSFGQYGNDKGDFCGPRGVCVDKDGFVYVCDNDNKRVQIF